MTPTLPFDGYKWPWASKEPTESLNDPAVFLGVLRVLQKYEGERTSMPALTAALNTVKRETSTPVNVVRTPARNLIRNSGQYWKSKRLMQPVRGKVILTPFGRKVASGDITRAEFASVIIKQMILPDPIIMSPAVMEKWNSANLTIKPLELILEILAHLSQSFGSGQAFITANELIQIIIPLAGNQVSIGSYITALSAFRTGRLDISSWPDCAPESNDKRIAAEYLLFLEHYGFLYRLDSPEHRTRFETPYMLAIGESALIDKFRQIQVEYGDPLAAVESAREVGFPAGVELQLVERERVFSSRLARPGQASFRRLLFQAYKGRCLLTQENMSEVLEAIHIRPVKHQGSDQVGNGFLLRVDVHTLFDGGHIRIDPHGSVHYSEATRQSPSYRDLPEQVELPKFISQQALEWRWNYT